MNGSVNTNDQGPHGQTGTPGGVGGTAVCPNDTQQINTANPPPGGGGGSVGGGGGGGCNYYSYDEWDDTTNTLTTYFASIC